MWALGRWSTFAKCITESCGLSPPGPAELQTSGTLEAWRVYLWGEGGAAAEWVCEQAGRETGRQAGAHRNGLISFCPRVSLGNYPWDITAQCHASGCPLPFTPPVLSESPGDI